MAQGNILVYGDASVQKKSILVVARKAAAQAPSQKNDGAAIAGLKPPNAPAGGKKIFGLGSSIQAKPGVFSVTFTGNATVSAMVITLDDSLGVKIDRNVIDSGIIRTHGAVSLDGRFWGRIFASKFVDGAAAVSGKPAPPLAVIHGSILPLDDMAGYRIPCFMGALSIVEWRED
jgi:hypothetical protein